MSPYHNHLCLNALSGSLAGKAHLNVQYLQQGHSLKINEGMNERTNKLYSERLKNWAVIQHQ